VSIILMYLDTRFSFIKISQVSDYVFSSHCLMSSFCGLKVAAMFKIGNSKDLPEIPEDLSDEGKDFVRQCLQRNPVHRPTASQLLEHPFVKLAAPLERPILCLDPTDPPPGVSNGVKILVFPFFMLSFHFY